MVGEFQASLRLHRKPLAPCPLTVRSWTAEGSRGCKQQDPPLHPERSPDTPVPREWFSLVDTPVLVEGLRGQATSRSLPSRINNSWLLMLQ